MAGMRGGAPGDGAPSGGASGMPSGGAAPSGGAVPSGAASGGAAPGGSQSPDSTTYQYTTDFANTDGVGKDVRVRMNMYNPMYYLSSHYEGHKTSTVAPHWRIRTGIMQGDTANTIEINLALALANLGVKNVDFATVWGLGHTMAERTGEASTNFIDWVKSSLR